ncbi:transglycosylase domain-containing protein [Zhouia spongiae]|uniref:Transglycosylase domain-containing protein n=1 Tax=Zhouia spongiae TaxID=2202721 RepID=A0ABY3YNR1_9FLAO|nr:transglycosylase domain-containing protein [Zhouia spongiae]UNY99338.1 transglycosylase domain-containing protein [Zhouia spongiae]
MGVNNKKRFLKIFLKTTALLLLAVTGFCVSVYAGLWGKLPDVNDLKELKQAQASLVLDENDELIGKYFVFDRQSVKYKELPQNLIDALIATEDVRFYEHSGVDMRSLGRVFFKTILLSDESSGGGSTITTQLVKNLYGRKNHGVFSMPVNKVKEAITARRIERIFPKEDIITLYFNTVPFSDNTFGIESASQKFFDCSTSELSLSQAATLVGTLKASHSYNPRLYPERSQFRRDVVLQQMVKYNFITEDEANKVKGEKLELAYQYFDSNEGLAPYFREQVRREAGVLVSKIKKEDGSVYDLYKDGLRIYTTLNARMQEYAEDSMEEHMAKLQQQFEQAYGKRKPWKNKQIVSEAVSKLPEYQRLKQKGLKQDAIYDSLSIKKKMKVFDWKKEDELRDMSTLDSISHYLKLLNTGFVALDPHSGAVKAYVGGIDFQSYKYDHVFQSKRQVGSTFKPFVYTAALENGMEPCTYFSLKAITYEGEEDWTPENASKNEDEDITVKYALKKALSNSINTIAVKVMDETGVEAVISQARKMGIETDLPQVPSLALGTAEMSLMELASAYTGFVNKGVSVKPYLIERVEDREGNILWEYKPKIESMEPAYSDQTRESILEMLKATVNEGTAIRIRNRYGLKNDMAGKTGTTQNNKDGWFVAVTPDLVMASWVGNDDHRIGFSNTAIGQGANSALPTVALFLKRINADTDFQSISNARFDRPSDEVIAALDCEPLREETFFERIFDKEVSKKKFGEKKKKGIFSFLKKKNKEEEEKEN